MSAPHIVYILNRSGHLTLTWDHDDPVDRERARGEVEELRAAGYSFFAVEGATGIDEIERGKGHLVVRRVEQIFAEPVVEAPTEEDLVTDDTGPIADGFVEPGPKKRGRPKGSKNKAKAPVDPPAPELVRHVAVRQMRGG